MFEDIVIGLKPNNADMPLRNKQTWLIYSICVHRPNLIWMDQGLCKIVLCYYFTKYSTNVFEMPVVILEATRSISGICLL